MRARKLIPIVLLVAVQAAPSALASPPPRPGPPALYARPAHSSLLETYGRWDAAPLMVSGAAAIRSGEFVYQDYLYDDFGANTTNGRGSPEPRVPTSELTFGAMSGDVVYPTAGKRYGYNAADLVELRIDASRDSVAYRFTLNTMLARDATAIAVGIDTNGGKSATNWGYGLGRLGPLDLEHVLFTNGVTAEVSGRSVAVETDLRRNQIEVVVPRSVLDPGTRTWRHYAVTGIANGGKGFAPLESTPTKKHPGGARDTDAPPVFNVAFRYESQGDEPLGKERTELGSRSPGVGYGHWRDHGQAKALEARDISRFHGDVDFGALARGQKWSNVPRRGYMNRIYVSRLDLGEGVAAERPWLLGNLQPYSVYVPKSYRAGHEAPFQLVLHSLSCTYNQFAVISPNTYRDLAEEPGAIAMTTMGRGPDGWYLREAELDVFEAWADVARHYDLDEDRVYLNGYSMGGYGTFKLAAQYPDLFAGAFPVVGPQGEGISLGPVHTADAVDADTNTYWILENVMHVPFLIWHGVADELVPVAGTLRHGQRFNSLGYRYEQDVFASDHFALGEVDEWDRGKRFLKPLKVERDPWRVRYEVMPGADVPRYGLVHDHAYWVWDIVYDRHVTTTPDQGDHTGVVDVTSLAFPRREPRARETYADGGIDPLPYAAHGITWGKQRRAGTENALSVLMYNVSDVTVGLKKAGIATDEKIGLTVYRSGKDSVLHLYGDFDGDVHVVSGKRRMPFTLKGKLLSIPLGGGWRGKVYVVP
jgi:predicted esterase